MAANRARRPLRLFVLLFLPLLLEAQARPAPRPYALQDMQLGAPLSELRQLRFVEETVRGKLRLLCSSDADSVGIDLLHPLATTLQPDEVRCALFERDKSKTPPVPGKIEIFGEAVAPLLVFYPPEDGGGEPRLTEIIVRFDNDRFQQIVAFMRRAYGAANNYEMTTMQTYFGDMVIASYYWNNDVSTIEADSLTLDLDKMSVTFKFTELEP